MDTSKLKKFAQFARRSLLEQVGAKLDLVLDPASAARREHPEPIVKLEAAVSREGKEQVIERAAYTWFNRFSALRFMDLNELNAVRIVSPLPGQFQPEILTEAKAGNLDEALIPEKTRQAVRALLEGRVPSSDPQAEAYRLLLMAVCNYWHKVMPFLFEWIDDYTELLLPEDLQSNASILAYLRETMTPDACEDVEIIGWLYQFYISEKKDEVFADLKKNVKITAENIPAATQLFTPHWIVRYLVENSLGRLWLLNRPESGLAAQMDYYIAPEEPETDFLRITRPEDIRICDPACGSGHMLTYAFDLLTAIYEEEGYDATEIPTLILRHNLTGVEIDDRAGALAAFALVMKAAARPGGRRFLHMETKPDICVLQNVSFTASEMQDVAAVVGEDLFTDELRKTLAQFGQARTFGSLIEPKLRDPAETLRVVGARDFESDLLLREVQDRVVAVLRMAEALSPKYHVVVANPPYMGRRGMDGKLQDFLKDKFADVKSDLFSAFMVRNTQMALPKGQLGFMTPFVWMFISSYEKLRLFLLERKTITTLIQLEYSGFEGATVPICTFTLENSHRPNFQGGYVRLSDFRGAANQGPRTLEAIQNHDCGWFHRASAKDFENIPGSPIAYWASDQQKKAFIENRKVADWCGVKQGLATANNDRFLRLWHEISEGKFGVNYGSTSQTKDGQHRWFPYNKGGKYRRWYGNFEYVVNWERDGSEIRNFADDKGKITSRAQNTNFYFKEGVTWTFVSSGSFGVRYAPTGSVFDVAGSSAFPPEGYSKKLTGALASKVACEFLTLINPTLNFQVGNIAALPFDPLLLSELDGVTQFQAISLSKSDWDAFETSWDFTTLPLLDPDHQGETLEASYAALRAHWQGMTDEMQRLEEENNRIFIDAYGLRDELTPDVPLSEITLTCNPAYSIGGDKTDAEREDTLRARTMTELLSYAVGCMFGRYSLNAPGLILANQGEMLTDYLARVPNPCFEPDDDNVIPMLDADWFPDDITERFRLFLRVSFGEAHFRENLHYIENALGKDIRQYFTKDFYADHVKRYKKRPIYWMISSPKGTFNALIYMHRYQSDTVSVLLNDYLRAFIKKLEGERKRLELLADDPDATQGERTKAQKAAAKIATQITELSDWEERVILPRAQEKIDIDLDDGVKANYPKFGSALKKVTGLS